MKDTDVTGHLRPDFCWVPKETRDRETDVQTHLHMAISRTTAEALRVICRRLGRVSTGRLFIICSCGHSFQELLRFQYGMARMHTTVSLTPHCMIKRLFLGKNKYPCSAVKCMEFKSTRCFEYTRIAY